MGKFAELQSSNTAPSPEPKESPNLLSPAASSEAEPTSPSDA